MKKLETGFDALEVYNFLSNASNRISEVCAKQSVKSWEMTSWETRLDALEGGKPPFPKARIIVLQVMTKTNRTTQGDPRHMRSL